ncbi:MAG TPA: hypothetical protein VHY09_10445 [Candidatus Methylacidiphilales bacterium]|jgi:uncharacterized metal-binding protein YceD (DUF177 family)|nr:hypothetical protein [Candidatus Methylacidiphilales bacterium]
MSLTFSPALVTEREPLEIREQISPRVLALDDPTARAEQPVDVEVTVQKDEDTFVVTGWARTTLLLRCGRDGEFFPKAVRATVEHHFEAPHPAHIDLTSHIREDILLEIPLNAVCQLKQGNRCPVTNEVIKPRKESTEAIAPPKDVWAELSKLEPAKPKARKLKPKK